MAGTDAEAVASSMVADTASAGREVRVQPGMTEFCHPERWEVRGADSVSFCGSEPGSIAWAWRALYAETIRAHIHEKELNLKRALTRMAQFAHKGYC